MRDTSHLVLPCDPGYTGHRDAEKRHGETRDWLRQREREVAAPSIVPERSEPDAPAERKSTHSR
jgi:hypothetical protein